jgi:epsilon-lactone hydrolase
VTSWQNRLIELVLRVRRTKRSLSTAAGARKMQQASALRPLRYGPPKAMDRRVRLSVEHVAGWPVYSAQPKRGPASKHVLYLHGGAYVAEVAKPHWKLVEELVTASSAEVLLPIYPLAPASTAAETVPAVAALVSRLIEQHSAEDVVLMGDSAGGGMALAVAQLLRNEGRRQPAEIVLIAPWLDVTMSDPRQREIDRSDPWLAGPGLAEAGRLYAGELDPTDFRVSPLHGDISGLPPITVFTGTRDILHTDALGLADRASAAGSPLNLHTGQGLFHVYPLLPTPEGKAARAQIVRQLSA